MQRPRRTVAYPTWQDMMSKAVGTLEAACHCATLFDDAGAIDEGGLRQHLRRMVAAGVGVVVGTPGAGEGQALSEAELARVVAIAKSECGSVVPVRAVAREAHDARGTARSARAAAAAGADAVGIFPLQGGHGMVPTLAEQVTYYRAVLGSVDGPLGLVLHLSLIHI